MTRYCLIPIVLAALARPAFSQQPLTPEQRAERRERLRTLGRGAAGQLLEALGRNGAGPDGAADPTVQQLNALAAELVDSALAGETAVESVDVRFDEAETDIAADKLRLLVDAQLARTRWSTSPTRLSAAITASVGAAETGGPQAVFELAGELQTDVLALVNHLAEIARRAGDDVEAATDPLAAAVHQRLVAAGHIGSLDDAADLMLSIAALRLGDCNRRIDALKLAAQEGDADSRAEAARALVELRVERDRMLAVHPRIERDSSGSCVAIYVEVDQLAGPLGLSVPQLEVALKPNQALFAAQATASQGLEVYPLVKPLVLTTIRQLQSGDPATRQRVLEWLALPLSIGREFVFEPTP